MSILNRNDYAIIELLAIKPLYQFSEKHLPLVTQLSRKGVVARQNDRWYLTKVGLLLAGRTLH